jgi:hypothetical protein
MADLSNMGLLLKTDNTLSLSDKTTFISLPAKYKDLMSLCLVDSADLGAIAALATSDAGAKTQITSALHGLANGTVITVSGTTSYNGTYIVEQVATNTFVIPKAFVANDATGMWLVNIAHTEDPLTAFSGGWDEYLVCMAESTTPGTPTQYIEQNGRIYLYPPADGDYGVLLEYQKYDNQDDTTIEFGDEFSNALKFGSLYFYAMMKGRERYVALWQNKYEVEKEFRRLNLKKPVCITR